MTNEEIKKIFESKFEHCNPDEEYQIRVNMEIESLIKEDNTYREKILKNIIDKSRK